MSGPGAPAMRPVLVTDGGNGQSRSALAAVRALGAAGHDVHVTTTGPVSVPGWSRHCRRQIRTPVVTSAAYAAAIDALRAQVDYAAVFPASDAALLALDWPGSSLVHKLEVARSAERAGFPVAAQRSFDAAAQLLDAAEVLPYPVVVKTEARQSPSGPAVWRADEPADLAPARGRPGPFVVQEWLTGGMRAVAGVIWDGELRAVAHQEYLRTWPRACGVASAARTTGPDLELEGRLPQLLAGYDGIFQVQLIGDHVIDINPRVYGSMALGVRAGVNLPSLVCRLHQGDGDLAAPRRARSGVRYRWLEGDVRHVVQAVGDGQVGLAAAAGALLPRPGTAHGDVSATDPLPTAARLLYAGRSTSRAAELPVPSPQSPPPPPPPPPSAQAARDRELTHDTVATALADVLHEGGLRVSPLGPAWSRDVDAYVRDWPDAATLEGRGWINVDDLLGRLGHGTTGRWAVVVDERIVGAADLERTAPPHPVDAVVARIARQGWCGPREHAELAVLRSRGLTVPADLPTATSPPVHRRLRWALRNMLRPRVVLRLTGADASTRRRLRARIVEDLDRAGVPARASRALLAARGVVLVDDRPPRPLPRRPSSTRQRGAGPGPGEGWAVVDLDEVAAMAAGAPNAGTVVSWQSSEVLRRLARSTGRPQRG